MRVSSSRRRIVPGVIAAGLLAFPLGAGLARAQGPLSPQPAPLGPQGVPTSPLVPSPTPPTGVAPATTTTPGTATGVAPAAPSVSAAPPDTPPAGDEPIQAAGTEPADTPEKPAVAPANVYTLARCLALADARAPQIRMAGDRLAMAHAQLDEVRFIPWSQWSVSGGIATVPEIRGTAVYSPQGDISLSSKLGPAWRVTVEGVVPLWTFGKITAAAAAAKANVEVALADVEKTRNLVRHDVRRAYFGLMMAHDARYLLELAQNRLQGAVDKAEDNEDSDEADVLRMKTYLMEVKARLGEVEKYERIALAGLRFLTGVESPAPFEVPDEPIRPPKKPLVDLLVYLKAAQIHRPELRQAKAGLEARSAQVDLQKARLLPDVGLGMFFGYANAPYVTDQTNAFVLDQANYLRFGIGVVFKWNLDVLPAAARVRYAQAQLAEMRDLASLAMGGVGVEVETAYGIAKDAQTREKFYGEAEALAKRWVAAVTAAITVGTKEERDIVEPLRAYLTNRYNHLQAIMDLDVAYSQLSLATGDPSVAEYD